jgi:hypothetical protein
MELVPTTVLSYSSLGLAMKMDLSENTLSTSKKLKISSEKYVMPSKRTSKVGNGTQVSTVGSASLPVAVKRSLSTVSKQQVTSSLTNAQLSQVLSKIATIRAWASAVEAEALNRLLKDQKIPDYKLVEGRSFRAWENAVEVEKFLLKHLKGLADIDIISPRSLLSPAQIETFLKKSKHKEKWDKIAKYITRPPGKLAIAPAIDPRPEVTRGSEFAELGEDE